MFQNIKELENINPVGTHATGTTDQRQGQKAPENVSDTNNNLTEQDKRKVEQLKRRETEVKAHELAHKRVGGQYIRGGVQYTYETGPDNKRYISGGEVAIDTSEIPGDPEKTVDKMKIVHQAALAPAKPSTQDRRVASEAKQKEMEAHREITEEKQKKTETTEKEKNITRESTEPSSPFYSGTNWQNNPTHPQNNTINLLA